MIIDGINGDSVGLKTSLLKWNNLTAHNEELIIGKNQLRAVVLYA